MKSVIKRMVAMSDPRWETLHRIMSNSIIDPVTGCWEWQGGDSGRGRGGGYGRMSVHGYLPLKKQIDHTCNNRICCNPEHLEMVTHKQNQRRKTKR